MRSCQSRPEARYQAAAPVMRTPRSSSWCSVHSAALEALRDLGRRKGVPSGDETSHHAVRIQHARPLDDTGQGIENAGRLATASTRICAAMPGYGTAFGRGLILGAGAALLYAAARETIAPARSAAADDEDARRHARPGGSQSADRLGPGDQGGRPRRGPHAEPAPGRPRPAAGPVRGHAARHRGAHRHLHRQRPVAGQHEVEVLDRPAWIRANMVNFRSLLQPVEDFYTRKRRPARASARRSAFQQAARMMLSSQIGVLVGYLSRRVLGQYDIALLGDEPADGRQAVLRRAQPAPGRGDAGRAARRAAALDRAARGDPRPRVRAVPVGAHLPERVAASSTCGCSSTTCAAATRREHAADASSIASSPTCARATT